MSDEIERQILNLEYLVCMLAQALLLKEHGKDLSRDGIEEACKLLAHHADISGAVNLLRAAADGGTSP